MKRAFVVLLAATVLLAAVALSMMVRRTILSRQTTLTTGHHVEVLGATKSGETFTTETPWTKLARKHLPSRWRKWLPQSISHTSNGATQSIVIYLRVSDSTGALAKSLPWSTYQAEDDGGRCFPGDRSYGLTRSGTLTVGSLRLRGYPRRQHDFLLRFLGGHGESLGSLRVPNPMRGPFPQWRAEDLPISHTNGPVVLTLESAEISGLSPRPQVQAKWRVTSTNDAWARTSPDSVLLDDPTGNGDSCVSPNEPVWRLSTRVVRYNIDDLSAEDKLTLTNIAPPGPGEMASPQHAAVCSGVRLRALAGPGILFFTNDICGSMLPPSLGFRRQPTGINHGARIESWDSERPFLLLEILDKVPHGALLVRVTDQRGQEVKRCSSGDYLLVGGRRMHKLEFQPPEGTESLSLSVALSRPLSFEFFVRPSDIGATNTVRR
ncbi:MAG: hypothetical protein HZA90_02005 [Verrucomicrobia bacterium]|nr:hypothetical protein [Verrucomicrobiota bacterium]